VFVPKIKISQNPQKVTNPGVKKIIRFRNGNDRIIGDLLMDVSEPPPGRKALLAHHPIYDYMKKTYRPPFTYEELLVPVFLNGKQVYWTPEIDKVRARALEGVERLEPEYKRFSNPHIYKVSLSERVYHMKKELLSYHRELAHRGASGGMMEVTTA
jgi:nicotinate phosphoribosyltransferase